MSNNKLSEKTAHIIFFMCSVFSVISIIAIIGFIFGKGIPLFKEVSFTDFIFGTEWKPTSENPLFGIYPMIVGTIAITFFSSLIGIPIGVLTGIFINEYSNTKMQKILIPLIELLSGIPSVVYGFFGVIVIVPFIGKTFGGRGGGNSLLAGIIVLVIMILPTIVTTTKTALSAVPKEFLEGSYALGVNKEHTIIHVLMPAAKSGIYAGIILGIGRAIGETMAIILVTGNAPVVPHFINDFKGAMIDPVRTLTSNIALEMSYASGLHETALFATAIVLLFFILCLNLLLAYIKRKG